MKNILRNIKVAISVRLDQLQHWQKKHGRFFSSFALFSGFAFDILTLKRVDLPWENFWIASHLIIVGACIVLIEALPRQIGAENNPRRWHFWLLNIQQFFYGGVWSAFLVFYFRSSDLAASWPFLLILALSFLANERLKRHFVRLIFQISLFYLAVFSFLVFLVPVLMGGLGDETFLLAGFISLVFIVLFLFLIKFVTRRQVRKQKRRQKKIQQNVPRNIQLDEKLSEKQDENELGLQPGPHRKRRFWILIGVASVFLIMNVLYFADVLPPIPLSLKEGGIYYSVTRMPNHEYEFYGALKNWQNSLKLFPDFPKKNGQPIYVYSAIFSPPNFDLNITHQWQRLVQFSQMGKNGKIKNSQKWITVSEVPLHVTGGREGGFRTYSYKTNPDLGKWRVNVLSPDNRVIGRIRFTVVGEE